MGYPPPPRISYANVHNYYGPYAYCSLDKGVACAQHIQLLTHTVQATCAESGISRPMACVTFTKTFYVLKLANVTTNPCLMWPLYILYVIKLRTKYYGPYAYCSLDKGVA